MFYSLFPEETSFYSLAVWMYNKENQMGWEEKLLRFYLKRYWGSFLWAFCAVFGGILLVWLSRGENGFAQWYATHVFPIFPNTIGRLFSILPFSLYEFILYGLVLGCLAFLVVFLVFLFCRREKLRRLFCGFFRFLLWGVPAVFLMLTLTCSINYGRTSFGAVAGYEMQDSSVAQLEALCEELAQQANDYAGQIPIGEHGGLSISGMDLAADTKAAMAKLSGIDTSLGGCYPNPKPVTFSWGMSHLRLTGVYSPYTIEANYNRNIPDFEIPYTVCHELAHLKGYIREDEAGFIAYLACRESGNASLGYSGSLYAFSYAMNALYAAGAGESYMQIYGSLAGPVKADYAFSNAYWKSFETKVAEVSNAVNDSYLKANAQEDGVKSYGRMVDLLLAERRSRG